MAGLIVPAGSMDRDFFDRPFLEVARDLVGASLVWDGCGGRIVEVEAYGVTGDEACHTASRPTSRAFVREKPPGTAYVYLNYGIHWLLNVLARDGIILFRALEPELGLETMSRRRGTDRRTLLCSGPGRLGQALGLGREDHGRDLALGCFVARPAGATVRLAAGPRIGITKAVDLPWRFMDAASDCLSRPPAGERKRVAGPPPMV